MDRAAPAPLQAQTVVDSPLGPLTLAASAAGLAIAWFEGQAHRVDRLDLPEDPRHPHLRLARAEFDRYWDAPLRAFTVPLDARGTAFRHAVWDLLRALPASRCASYGELARRLGRPTAARAVGAAVGHNPLAIVVPCHRVVGADGALTGYAGGLPRKRELLRREHAATAAATAASGDASRGKATAATDGSLAAPPAAGVAAPVAATAVRPVPAAR